MKIALNEVVPMNEINRELERLSQSNLLARLNREIPPTEMVTVYWSDRSDAHEYSIYGALFPSTRIEETLSRPSWDLRYGDGMPGAIKYTGEDGEPCVEYLRFGDRHFEPLVIDRGFDGVRPRYIELSEEFRLFHQLYHDRKLEHFIKIEDDGNETIVATLQPRRVEVRLKELRQFLAIKEMHLAIQFDCREHSTHSLDELGLSNAGSDQRDGLLCWRLDYANFDGCGDPRRAFSRLLGKRLIQPLPKEKSGFWGFAEEEPKNHVEFIIGTDEHGGELSHTCDPDALANYFGANPGAPHYLTPVHFRKTVLDKYFQKPAKYTVDDSVLWCGHLWCMDIDNHHDDEVCAWLGDLGRDLPYAEQLHWRSHNVGHAGGVSKTFYRRQILAQFTDSDRPEHVLSNRWRRLTRSCEEDLV